ncbi:MAG: ABC transporter ATP-binding protein [Phycisphaerae bacterium]
MNEIIRLENIGKVYNTGHFEVTALRGIDLRIQQGEYLAIMGHSGSGKSTILNILGCLDRPTEGEYWLGDEDVSTMTDSQLSDVRNRKIGFVFQSFNLIAGLTVLENIEVPLFYQGEPHSRRRPRSTELAREVGLGDRMHHRPNELSGGQRQRVAIARSLANNPLVVLADEPTGNLDTATTVEILDLFDRLHAEGRTIIMVTHEHDVAERAKRVIWLRDGAILSDDRTDAVEAAG